MYDPVQTAKVGELSGEWCRWSRYELIDGVIAPADGAKLEAYDPWEKFRSNIGKYRTVEQPYSAFLDLNHKLEQAAPRNSQPTSSMDSARGPQNDADRLVTDWCNEHGLLGILPVLSNSIRYAVPPKEHAPVVRSVCYLRRGGSWIKSESLDSSEPKPLVTWLDWMTGIFEAKPLEEVEIFFPGLTEFAPPLPSTPEFWKCYGEPAQSIRTWCKNFARAVDSISNSDAADGHQVQISQWCLGSIAEGATVSSFRFDTQRRILKEQRASPGLLASYALMFLWDRANRRRALRCQNCDRYFVSDEQRARYCSPTCRNTAQSRRYRSKIRSN